MSKKTNTDVTRVTYRWDDQPGVDAGWYCQSFVEGDKLLGDSQKVWFPVSVDNYGEDEEDELVEALGEAFPNAEIVKSCVSQRGDISCLLGWSINVMDHPTSGTLPE